METRWARGFRTKIEWIPREQEELRSAQRAGKEATNNERENFELSHWTYKKETARTKRKAKLRQKLTQIVSCTKIVK